MKAKSIYLALAFGILLIFSACESAENPTATIIFSTGDEITIRLLYDKAPNTVLNFISLANDEFYSDLTIHRVEKYMLLQMGDPEGDGSGDPGYYIKGEFPANGFKKNDLTHTPGMVGMARLGSYQNDSDYYDTAGCQFYIMTGDQHDLDGKYAIFGEVIRGFDSFAQLDTVEVDENKCPIEPIYIKSVTVETFGKSYDKPKILTSNFLA